MSDPYQRANAGRLTFKGGELAAVKSIDKKKKKKKNNKQKLLSDDQTTGAGEDGGTGESEEGRGEGDAGAGVGGEQVYTIDAAKKMKYEELFPVEAKKFRYDPANKARTASRTVEQALDDRVKKKADRYCK